MDSLVLILIVNLKIYPILIRPVDSQGLASMCGKKWEIKANYKNLISKLKNE